MSTPVQSESRLRAFFTKPTSRRTAAIMSGGALIFGLAFGGGTSGASNASEIERLTDELDRTSSVLSDAENDIDASEANVDRLEAAARRFESIRLEQARTIDELSAQLAAAESAIQAQAETIKSLELVKVNSNAGGGSPPSQAYYKNCTAARNAGAAPVHRGQPGYGPHLDRDGDGVGCE